jgi:NitT/TauT family transport system permease protein
MTATINSSRETTQAPTRTPRIIRPSAPRRRGGGILRKAVPPVLVAGVAIGIWYLVAYFALSPSQQFILPPPHRVVSVGYLQWAHLKDILEALKSTGTVALISFVLSTVIGLLFAIAMSEAKWIERSFYPFAVALQTIPYLAMVPLIGFWFGYDETSRIIVATVASIFPITTNALFGLTSGDKGLNDLLRLHNKSRLVRLIRLRLPTAMPAIFTGLRISAGLCVIASIVTDFFIRQGNPGIGGLLDYYSSNLDAEQLYAALGVTCAFGLLVFWVVGLVRKITIGRWEPTATEHSED